MIYTFRHGQECYHIWLALRPDTLCTRWMVWCRWARWVWIIHIFSPSVFFCLASATPINISKYAILITNVYVYDGLFFCCLLFSFSMSLYIPIRLAVLFFNRQKTIKVMWTLTTTLALSAHISTFDRGVSHIVAAPLITAIRIFYSASLCWMIVASHTGHGGLFAKIMNAPAFVHLNKLSYAIYLLNPVLITVIYGYRDHSSHVDPVTSVTILRRSLNSDLYIIAKHVWLRY